MTEPSHIRILVADDHPMMREGIVGLLGRQSDMSVVGEARDGREAVDLFERLRPDLTLMDIQMPELTGLEAIRQIRALDPQAAIVVLTTYPGDALAVQALQAGASGYLLKNCIRRDLLTTVRDVVAGRRVIAPEVAQQIALYSAGDRLTEREIAILKDISEGRANKEIARRLNVSVDTVKADMKRIFSKLDVTDRTRAVIVAIQRGSLCI